MVFYEELLQGNIRSTVPSENPYIVMLWFSSHIFKS